MSYAIIENGAVVNIVEWDGTTNWQPPEGTTVVQIPAGSYVGIGSTYVDGTFGDPPQPPAVP
ncbi:hypothetical protein C7399_109192 [Paraburkholderia tropica]|uniref:Uncharacterized protein n=1 Tax=Paraburkholderia tropica TaxID=92647 RepID=A0ABX5MNZ7_9BURK|nr:hypothetical protein C7400_109192 [Paraburkholderia tropica]PZW82116.1 hypothetical protein C7399_109192 [Paraburkholderia tropica]